MQFITIGVLTALSALLALGPTAKAADISTGTVLFSAVEPTTVASLAWAGENESFFTFNTAGMDLPEGEVDVRLMTGLAAPEPPAIVLAGMALGGLICGRSLLQKRRKSSKETT
jgi:hypothetical protein